MSLLGHNQIGARMNIHAHMVQTPTRETANTMEAILSDLAEAKIG
jgi:hypothetical protein